MLIFTSQLSATVVSWTSGIAPSYAVTLSLKRTGHTASYFGQEPYKTEGEHLACMFYVILGIGLFKMHCKKCLFKVVNKIKIDVICFKRLSTLLCHV